MARFHHPLIQFPRWAFTQADGRIFLYGGIPFSEGQRQACGLIRSEDQIPVVLKQIQEFEAIHAGR